MNEFLGYSSFLHFTLAIARILQSGTRLPVNNFRHKMVKIKMVNLGSVLNYFFFLSVSGLFGVEVTNTSGAANVLSSNLTGPVCFSNSKYSVPQKFVG